MGLWHESASSPDRLTGGAIDFDGRVIPIEWFIHLRQGNLIDLGLCLVLSDIAYWYRPSPIRDPHTQEIVGYQRKFKGNTLKVHYHHYQEAFGLEKNRVRAIMDQLVQQGLIVVTAWTEGADVLKDAISLTLMADSLKRITGLQGYGQDVQKAMALKEGYAMPAEQLSLPSQSAQLGSSSYPSFSAITDATQDLSVHTTAPRTDKGGDLSPPLGQTSLNSSDESVSNLADSSDLFLREDHHMAYDYTVH